MQDIDSLQNYYHTIFLELMMNKLLTTITLFCFSVGTYAQTIDINEVRITRLLDAPIIAPGIHTSIGENIQGPTVVRVPDWVDNPLGKYYLYFADHKGLYIRLAYADAVTGPWYIHEPGSLQIADSFFLTGPPQVSDEELQSAVAQREASGIKFSHDLVTELTTPHIASPDIQIDEENRRFILYYHGLAGLGRQFSRVATSSDGVNFSAREENLGRSYMRAFTHEGITYIMSMPGQFYRSQDGLTDFEIGPRMFEPNMRHSGLLKHGNDLYVFWTRVGDAPESILLSHVDISGDWSTWKESEPVLVMSPERAWEGANSPTEPSVRSSAYGLVNQLRDPALLVDGNDVYLFYAIGGESGIAVARVDF